ncbi:MAG: cysteine--tRNA ligase, partial [Deltaproteobacteria bacterium]|nr:cysteine--tRNA ligase [Deltaproteobacteria bacterium]
IRIYRTLRRVEEILKKNLAKESFALQGSLAEPEQNTFLSRFVDAMNDDLNTPNAIALIFEKITDMNKTADAGEGEKEARSLEQDLGQLRAAAEVLGILEERPEAFFETVATPSSKVDPAEIEALIEKRAKARTEKNFAMADDIRKLLKEKGIVLEDGPKGTSWRYDI